MIGRGLYRLLAHLERQLPFGVPESLVLAMVHVERGLPALRPEHLDERVAPARLLARGLDGPQGASAPPSCLSLTFLEPEGLSCDLLRSSTPPFLCPAGPIPARADP